MKFMSLNITLHRELLIKILKDIFDDNILSECLGFKGGTAAMLFYGLDRFSVDLDFDLLNIDKKEIVTKKISELLQQYGTLKESKTTNNGLLNNLSYHDKIKGAHNIKVDISFRNFGSHYEIHEFLGIAMNVMTKADMAANKLVALYERLVVRDIYDVCFFLKHGWPVNTQIITNRTNLDYKIFLQKCIEMVDKLTEKDILSDIAELLDDKQKTWVKQSLKKDTIFLLKLELYKVQEADKLSA